MEFKTARLLGGEDMLISTLLRSWEIVEIRGDGIGLFLGNGVGVQLLTSGMVRIIVTPPYRTRRTSS